MVTTIVHNHMNAATPMDVDTHIIDIEKEKAYGDSEEYEDNLEQDHDSEQHVHQDEEGGSMCHMGQSSAGGWQTKGKLQGTGKFDTARYNCGKTGHRSRECWSERSRGKGTDEQKDKEDTSRASTDTKAATMATTAAATAATAATRE